MTKEMQTTKTRAQTIRRQLEGVVVGDSKDKTIQVVVKRVTMHPKYRKQYVQSKKYAVHDPKNQAKAGDTVVFAACRPISKTKKWRWVRVLRPA